MARPNEMNQTKQSGVDGNWRRIAVDVIRLLSSEQLLPIFLVAFVVLERFLHIAFV